MWKNILKILQSKFVNIKTNENGKFSLDLSYVFKEGKYKRYGIKKESLEMFPTNSSILFGTRGTDFVFFPKNYNLKYEKDNSLVLESDVAVEYRRNVGYLYNVFNAYEERQDTTEQSQKQWYLYHKRFNIHKPFILNGYRKGVVCLTAQSANRNIPMHFDVYINNKLFKHFTSSIQGNYRPDPLTGIFDNFICYFDEYDKDVSFEVKNMSNNVNYIEMWQIKAYRIYEEHPNCTILFRRNPLNVE